jgi:hypothetical protein
MLSTVFNEEILLMLTAIQHPVVGLLVPDQWNRSLMAFRKFVAMERFWYPDPEAAIALLTPQHQEWVRNWERHTAQLARVCRHSDVHSALLSLGVYEVRFSVNHEGQISPEQANTFQAFFAYEEQVCGNAQDALLRYYQHLRAVMPDWFDEGDDPDPQSIEELAPKVGFDGIEIVYNSSHGLCPVTMGWDPFWDREHGLEMILYRNQVLEICAASLSLLLLDPEDYLTAPDLVWGVKQLTSAEREALKAFVSGYEARNDE